MLFHQQRFRNLLFHCRGIDERPVMPNRQRKSLSVEHTFSENKANIMLCLDEINVLYQQLLNRLESLTSKNAIKNQFVKIKLSDFTQKTAESLVTEVNLEQYMKLLHRCYSTEKKSIRLIGLGVHFNSNKKL